MSQSDKAQSIFSWVVLASGLSHLFCCVLPVVFSLITLAIGLGTAPLWIEGLHDAMHGWEKPLLIFSGVMVALGWGVHVIATKINCRDTCCEQTDCQPKKNKAHKILKIATLLFVFNVAVFSIERQSHEAHDHHDDHHESEHHAHDH